MNSTRTSLAPIALAPAAKRDASGHRDADRVICVGTRFVDIPLTAGFAQQLPAERTLEIRPYASRIGEALVQPVRRCLRPARTVLECAFCAAAGNVPPDGQCGLIRENDPGKASGKPYSSISKPGDIIALSTGDCSFGAAALCRFLTARKLCWYGRCGDLGYSLPAAFGAQTACPTIGG